MRQVWSYSNWIVSWPRTLRSNAVHVRSYAAKFRTVRLHTAITNPSDQRPEIRPNQPNAQSKFISGSRATQIIDPSIPIPSTGLIESNIDSDFQPRSTLIITLSGFSYGTQIHHFPPRRLHNVITEVLGDIRGLPEHSQTTLATSQTVPFGTCVPQNSC